MNSCRWHFAPCDGPLCATLADQLQVPPLLVRCLLNRGLSDAAQIDAFLHPRLRDLADPFRLPDMAAAVQRLHFARQRQEPITLFGDYDVDGISAAALLSEVFRALGWRCDVYLPNRFQEGY